MGISVSRHICADWKTSAITNPQASIPGTGITSHAISSRSDTRNGTTDLVSHNQETVAPNADRAGTVCFEGDRMGYPGFTLSIRTSQTQGSQGGWRRWKNEWWGLA